MKKGEEEEEEEEEQKHTPEKVRGQNKIILHPPQRIEQHFAMKISPSLSLSLSRSLIFTPICRASVCGVKSMTSFFRGSLIVRLPFSLSLSLSPLSLATAVALIPTFDSSMRFSVKASY